MRASTATPGVTAKSILLEGTFPLSGPASGYAPIPAGMGAYFSYANAHGGVNGRQINWKYSDDGYNPANTVQLTTKFVQQDHAFALVGGLGTEPQQAVQQFLNANKVPQLFVSTGATTFDRDWAQIPVDASAGSPTTRPRGRSTASTSSRTCRPRSSASSTRTTPTATTTFAA